jgi:hypothetical protein
MAAALRASAIAHNRQTRVLMERRVGRVYTDSKHLAVLQVSRNTTLAFIERDEVTDVLELY